MTRLGTETAFEVLVKAKALEAQGRDIIHLEIGEPDFDTPANIIEAGCDALHRSFTHYGPSAGLMELREVIAQYVSETRRVNVTPDEVVIVPGGMKWWLSPAVSRSFFLVSSPWLKKAMRSFTQIRGFRFTNR